MGTYEPTLERALQDTKLPYFKDDYYHIEHNEQGYKAIFYKLKYKDLIHNIAIDKPLVIEEEEYNKIVNETTYEEGKEKYKEPYFVIIGKRIRIEDNPFLN